MKRFQFPLERVRKWRQEESELQEMRLRPLCDDLRAIESEQRELASEVDRCRRNVLTQTAVPSEDLAALEKFREYAVRQSRRLEAKRREARARVEEQRQRVIEAHRRFELLERLRAKALTSWTVERDKDQEQLAAELYLAKLGREGKDRPR